MDLDQYTRKYMKKFNKLLDDKELDFKLDLLTTDNKICENAKEGINCDCRQSLAPFEYVRRHNADLMGFQEIQLRVYKDMLHDFRIKADIMFEQLKKYSKRSSNSTKAYAAKQILDARLDFYDRALTLLSNTILDYEQLYRHEWGIKDDPEIEYQIGLKELKKNGGKE